MSSCPNPTGHAKSPPALSRLRQTVSSNVHTLTKLVRPGKKASQGNVEDLWNLVTELRHEVTKLKTRVTDLEGKTQEQDKTIDSMKKQMKLEQAEIVRVAAHGAASKEHLTTGQKLSSEQTLEVWEEETDLMRDSLGIAKKELGAKWEWL